MSGRNAKLIRKYFHELTRIKAITGSSQEYRAMKAGFQEMPDGQKAVRRATMKATVR